MLPPSETSSSIWAHADAVSEYSPEERSLLLQIARESILSLLEGREPVGGRAAAYVCEHFACKAPE